MPGPIADPSSLAAIRAAAADPGAVDGFLSELAVLVAIRSGTGDADGVGRVGVRLADALRDLGAEVTLRTDGPAGPTLIAVVRGVAPGARVALVGHLDTVPARTGDHGVAYLAPVTVLCAVHADRCDVVDGVVAGEDAGSAGSGGDRDRDGCQSGGDHVGGDS